MSTRHALRAAGLHRRCICMIDVHLCIQYIYWNRIVCATHMYVRTYIAADLCALIRAASARFVCGMQRLYLRMNSPTKWSSCCVVPTIVVVVRGFVEYHAQGIALSFCLAILDT